MAGKIFTHTHRVTYFECTIGNHIYHSRYFDLLEAARGEFVRELGVTCQQLQDDGTIFPVIEAHMRYKGPARYDDLLRIELWMNEVARIFNQRNELLIEAHTIHVCTGTDDKLKRLPAELGVKLEPYLKLQNV